MMLELAHTWTSTGSSGGLTAVEVRWPLTEATISLQVSTLASTQSWSVQTAHESTGPWYNLMTGAVSTGASTAYALSNTGPVAGFVRVYLHSASTGAYQFKLLGVS
jgi:hypothetical protein